MVNIVALMPMKEHNERLPNKNILQFNGKPLYYWMLSKLTSSSYINEVVVDTDSKHISNEIRREFPSVKIIDRIDSLVGDDISMNAIINHDISICDADVYIQTHSTNPLLRRETFESAIRFYLNNLDTHDSLFGVTEYNKMFWDSNATPLNHNPKLLVKTQQLKPLYMENSNLYIFSKRSFSKTGSRIGEHPYMFNVPADESFDIDYQIDFKIAEAYAKVERI